MEAHPVEVHPEYLQKSLRLLDEILLILIRKLLHSWYGHVDYVEHVVVAHVDQLLVKHRRALLIPAAVLLVHQDDVPVPELLRLLLGALKSLLLFRIVVSVGVSHYEEHPVVFVLSEIAGYSVVDEQRAVLVLPGAPVADIICDKAFVLILVDDQQLVLDVPLASFLQIDHQLICVDARFFRTRQPVARAEAHRGCILLRRHVNTDQLSVQRTLAVY